MAKLHLTLACGDYDRTKTLQDGSLDPDGIALNYLPMQAEEIFWRMGNHQEFDASEMSLSNYITMTSRGESPFTAVPVFPSRYFRHSCVFINTARGLDKPEDLAGKRIGVPEYSITAAVVDPRLPERRPRRQGQSRRVVHPAARRSPDGRNASSSGCRRRSRCSPSPRTGP